MKYMIVKIVRLTYNDDSDGTIDIDEMRCPSKDFAKEFILKEVCDDFEREWKNLHEAAKDLGKELSECSFSEDENTFSWYDNGQGETYTISVVSEDEFDYEIESTEWEYIGETYDD